MGQSVKMKASSEINTVKNWGTPKQCTNENKSQIRYIDHFHIILFSGFQMKHTQPIPVNQQNNY
jgi:hypothetical protein